MIWLLLFIILSVLSACIPGKYKDGDSCVDCPVGYYKGEHPPDNWSDVCAECPVGFLKTK